MRRDLVAAGLGLTAFVSLLLASTALAQDATPPQPAAAPETQPAKDEKFVEKVVVTASKRRVRQQDYPGSITPITGDTITARQAVDLQDISRSVPGLSLQQGGSVGLNRVTLRGLNSGGDAANTAFVLDEAPLSLSGANTNGGYLAADFYTYDLARIEVLRGPQGTLYGATAEGGLIRYVSRAPDPSGFAAGLEGGYQGIAHGSDAWAVRGYANLPLGDDAALRGHGYYDEFAGWVDNPNLGKKKLNEGNNTGGRLAALFELSTDFSIQLSATHQKLEQAGDNTVQVNGFSSPTNQFGLVNGLGYSSFTEDNFERTLEMYSAFAKYNLGFAELQSVTTLGSLDARPTRDLPTLANVFGPSTSVQSKDKYGVDKFSQEVRLLSGPDATLFGNHFEWLAGAFYTKEDVTFEQHISLLSLPTETSLGALAFSDLPSTFEDLAFYANATFQISPDFDIEAGIRHASNDQESQLTTSGLLVGAFTPPALSSSEETTTIQIAPRWRFAPDAMVYARYAQGYRPGGPSIPIPGGPPGLPTSFNSDKTENYEVGVKATLLDGKLYVDAAAYRIDWTDIQILSAVVVSGTPFVVTSNAGTARSQGFEWYVAYKPVEGLELSIVGAHTDATLTAAAPVLGAADGDELPYVAELTNTVNADYEFPVFGTASAFLGLSWSYVGERHTDFPFHIALPSYDVFDARAGVRDGDFTVQLFAKNLGDEQAITSYSPVGGFGGTGTAGLVRPRVIGIRIAKDF